MRINENNYVDKAEKVIKELAEESKQRNRGRVDMVTTSKLRNLLAMTADIYNQVLTWQSETLSDELNGRIDICGFVLSMNADAMTVREK